MRDLGTTPFQYQMFKVEKQIEFVCRILISN
jgi:hypothetical protein